uniref:F-box domain-containing protein n=1 Tax=Steinernema glaseri TaxID=37863 RepID=A0A1I8A0K8_9BILA
MNHQRGSNSHILFTSLRIANEKRQNSSMFLIVCESMDAVPAAFVESVCLCLDRDSIRESCKILSRWGKLSSSSFRKIHTLWVFVYNKNKLYAAAQPALSRFRSLEKAVPLHSVSPRFVNRFHIEPATWIVQGLPSSWKEITLDQLQQLARFIRPTTEQTHPVRYNDESYNKLWLEGSIATTEFLSMRLPVNSVNLWIDGSDDIEAVDTFLEHAGPLYVMDFHITHTLKQSTVDAMIDKFVPADGGFFGLGRDTRLTRDQLERLVLKCEMFEKKVRFVVHPEGATSSSKVTDFFDFDKHYSTKKFKHKGFIATRDGARLQVCVEYGRWNQLDWMWFQRQK